MTDPCWAGFQQVPLNVQDVGRFEPWYTEVPDFSRLTTCSPDVFDRVVLRHDTGVILVLNRHVAPAADGPFTGRRAGLDHVAPGFADREALELVSPPPRRPR